MTAILEKIAFYWTYPFVRYALIVGVLIALCSSLLGVTLVLKRFSFIGDGLSHVAFGAMSIAAVLKLTDDMPLTLGVTVVCAVLLLRTGQNTKIKGDAAIAMISVGALAIGYLLMNLFSTSSNLSGDVCSTLFGSTSILTLSKSEVWLCVGLSVVVVAVFLLYYNKIFAVTFDEDFAKAAGTKADLYNLLIAVIIAVVIVLAMNLVGSLLISALVIFPAHTSSAVLACLASWVMMLIGRVRFGELMKLVGWGVAAIVVIMTLNLGRSETAEGRVSTWIHLWTKSQTEKPIEHLSDTERSMIAIYNGGILGEGAGQSAMRVEMIHPESDYAYAFFVEEYGFILAVLLLMLYLWVFFRGIEIFRRCGTAFPGLLVLGLALLITCQALLHIMVTVNLIPETGQTLPLISRGGSSMLFTMIAFGMILSVSRQNDEQSHDRPKSETLYEK